MEVAYLVGTALDPYLVGGVLGPSKVVYVNIAGRPFAFLPLFVMLFVPALWPVFARIHAQGNRGRLRSLVVGTALGGAASVCLGAVIIILAREPIFGFLSAGQLQPSVIDLLSITLLGAASVVANVMSTLLNAIDGVRSQAIILVAAASVSLLLKFGALALGGITPYLATSAVTYVALTTIPLCILAAKWVDRGAAKE